MDKENVNNCGICKQAMPDNEKVFKYHGYSGDCPKPTEEEKCGVCIMRGRCVKHMSTLSPEVAETDKQAQSKVAENSRELTPELSKELGEYSMFKVMKEAEDFHEGQYNLMMKMFKQFLADKLKEREDEIRDKCNTHSEDVLMESYNRVKAERQRIIDILEGMKNNNTEPSGCDCGGDTKGVEDEVLTQAIKQIKE